MGSARRLLVTLAALMALAACAPRPTGHVEVLRYASPYSPNHPFSRADIAWMKYVEAESGGRLKVQPFWGGALISSDQSVIELRHGVADVALITPIYMRAGMKAMKTQAGFYGGVRTIEDQASVYRCLEDSFPTFDQELAGVHVPAIQGGNLPNGPTRDRRPAAGGPAGPACRRRPSRRRCCRSWASTWSPCRWAGHSAISKGVVDGVVASHYHQIHAFYRGGSHLTLLHVPRGPTRPGRSPRTAGASCRPICRRC